MSCGVGRRYGSDPTLLWLWCRLAATTPIRPLAWEPPYTTGAALEKGKKTKQNKTKLITQEYKSEVFDYEYSLDPLALKLPRFWSLK